MALDIHQSVITTPEPGIATDASFASILSDALKNLVTRWQRRFDDVSTALSQRVISNVKRRTDVTLANALEKVGMAFDFEMTPVMQNAMDATIAENVGLIKSIPQEYLRRVEHQVMTSVQKGYDAHWLRNELMSSYGVSKRRAEFIARDQTRKATTVIQSARQRDVGIVEGIWQHSHAGAYPRKSHVEAGQKRLRFRLDKGAYIDGKYILPGEEINCRCVWKPIMPWEKTT